ncbi:IclR family transcriptional regulator [Nocardioides sp. Iso805N]|uniref:IclR family transcriptional regulator n=1 Tax=Nocardioides sp. Iso805N TaxID=1283287 RepID=UPI000372E44E|nr:IclR family transcriptional regulator [Nocardioides sp. Iso805N]
MVASTPERDTLMENFERRGSENNGPASVVKALHLLDVFREANAGLGVSELARHAGMPVSTAYRLLAHLVEGGYVHKDGTRYRPGDKLVELGTRVLEHRTQALRELVAPHLGDLYSICGTTTRLGVLDGSEVIIVDKVVGSQTVPAPTAVGGRVSALCTALGKAQLAFSDPRQVELLLQGTPLPRQTRHSLTSAALLNKQLEQIRSTRIAFDREEAVVGQVCVATPLFIGGKARAAISVSYAAQRVDYRSSVDALLRTAGRIERVMSAAA